VFVTVCTANRRPLLANHQAATILRHCWRRAANGWVVGRYVLLPDPVHLFCAPHGDVSLGRWVQFWKALATRQWRADIRRPLWQRDFWDTQLRSSDGYDEKWEYVRWNPVRHGLVDHPDRWPFQGEIESLEFD
jgi:putative transposase